MNSIKSLAPIIDENAKILILGSIPGKQSLEKQEYYGNARNAFWKLMFEIHHTEHIDDYQRRVEFLNENNIAVWDVIESCDRKGSLDSNIKDEKPNNFEQLFANHPNIKHVFFNGAKAFDVFKKKIGFDISDSISFTKLTSTSPANTITFDLKLEQWKVIVDV